MSLSLAASLAIHGIAFGGVVFVANHNTPDLDGGMTFSGGALLVRLIDAPPGAGRGGLEVRSPTAGTGQGASEARRVESEPPPPQRASKQLERRRDSLRRGAAVVVASAVGNPDRASRRQPEPSRIEHPVEIARVARSQLRASPRPAPPARSSAPELGASSPSQGCVSSGPPGAGVSSEFAGSASGRQAAGLDRLARPAAPIRPEYPPLARQRGAEGDVTVRVWVGCEGEADRVAVSRSAGAEFDRAAIAAVRSARFDPALQEGREVPSEVALQVHFRLDQ